MRTLIALSFTILTLTGCGNYLNQKHSDSGANQAMAGGGETTLDFATIKAEILEPQCISCHEGRHNAYENYSVVVASASAIIQRITTNDPGRRMPRGGPALSQSDQDRFIEWVQAGAPEFAKEEDGQDGDDSDESGDGEEEEVQYSFADVKLNVFAANRCLDCHSQFEDYGPTKKSIGSILSLVLSDVMPYAQSSGGRVSPATDRQKEILMAWVAQGSPEFVGAPPTQSEEELLPNWVSIRNKILGPKCVLCHNSYGKRGPTSMGTYLELMAWSTRNPDLFNTDEPNESHFVGSMLGRVDDDEFFFDPMPFNQPGDDVGDIEPVTEAELDVIREWIRLGLPEN